MKDYLEKELEQVRILTLYNPVHLPVQHKTCHAEHEETLFRSQHMTVPDLGNDK
jgi:hypothetical protein